MANDPARQDPAGKRPIRALSLLSGGLDSRLAACVLREQGIEVHGVVFTSPFFGAAAARAAADQLGIPLHVLPFTDDILALVRNPPHGFGAGMNPCIDCHARMLKRAGAFMDAEGFHFLSTGEVLNERPMSQNRRSLEIVAQSSGYPDLVLRPLSARLLPETRPETLGWVDRNRLLALEGRSRKPQFELAERYGVRDYPQPAGGCLLTEPNFSARLRDLKAHEGLEDVRLIERLKIGRHFRLDERTRLVVGRNERDNEWLAAHADARDLVLSTVDVPGPTALLPACASPSLLRQAASICARYADVPTDGSVRIQVLPAGDVGELTATPRPRQECEALRIR
jgi:tRNA U34 2-thiouridine synthase MnmA/TrmU